MRFGKTIFTPAVALIPIAVGVFTFIIATLIYSVTMAPTPSEATGETGILPAASTISLSTNTSSISFTPNAAALANATLLTQDLIATVSTNSSAGYTLTVGMVGEEQCLRNAADTTANTACSGINSANQFQPLPSRDNPASSIPSGFWGASLPPFNAYSFIPASYDAPEVIRETDVAVTNEQTTLRFAVRADMSILPGTYTNTVVFTAIANPEPPALIYIQEINQLNCPVERTMVTDARDYRTYWVQRMPDGRCWMQTNLAYAGGGNNTFGDVVDLWNLETVPDLTSPNFMIPLDANPTDFPTQPSLATDGGANDSTAQFGYLYNWCAAFGGQSAACVGDGTMDPIDPSVSVCPAGWRIPRVEWDNDEFISEYDALNDAINNGSWTVDTGLRTSWLGMYAGQWQHGNISNAGSVGYYWNTGREDGWQSWRFMHSSTNPFVNVNAQSVTSRDSGASVRCIAEPVYIQEVNEGNCPEERTMVVDARDNRTYWVQRMPDGRCWMQTNLAYAGGGDNTFGDVVTLTNEEGFGDFYSANFMIPPGANPTTFPQAPSTATDGGVDTSTRQFGYLYNWCAAMGNQQGTAACMEASDPLPDPNVSICPAGWRLPTVGGAAGPQDDTNEFWNLNQAVNNGVANTDTGLRTNWLGMYGGQWFWSSWQGWGDFMNVGAWGTYWSSSASGGFANGLLHTATIVSSSVSENKYSGQSVRCIAEPTLYIQEVNDLNCPARRTMVVDARDLRTYWVQRMPDGRCWMLTNLAYAGGGDNTFGDAVSLVNDEITPNVDSPNFMRPPGANPTTFPTTPSTATDGGVNAATRQFGYLYNWCAAMGDQQGTSACLYATAPLPDSSVSICPSGWRLPTTESNTGEFALLNNAINGGSEITDEGLRTQWLGMYGGRWWSSFNGIGSYGSYWTSVQRSEDAASLFGFANEWVDIDDGDAKTTGIPVRCIAEPTPPSFSVPRIQDITDANCPTTRTMVVDARDNRTYWVQRMPDGRCWMLTNLAYAGGGNNFYGDVVDGLVATITNSHAMPRFSRPPGANPTTYPTAPSTSTTGIGQYGYLYNWCAAMGNQQGTSACANAISPLPDRNTSICPAGWRLPTAGADGTTPQDNNTNEFWNLNQAVNEGVGLRTQWLGMYSGHGGIAGTFSDVGTRANYWSSTQIDAMSARNLVFTASILATASGFTKNAGLSVRCVAN